MTNTSGRMSTTAIQSMLLVPYMCGGGDFGSLDCQALQVPFLAFVLLQLERMGNDSHLNKRHSKDRAVSHDCVRHLRARKSRSRRGYNSFAVWQERVSVPL